MNVLIYDTEEQIGIAAGNYMCGQVLAKPNSVLGLATGSTPLKPYNHMIRLYEQGAVDFSKVTTFNLDEYCKLDVEDKNSYHSFMHENPEGAHSLFGRQRSGLRGRVQAVRGEHSRCRRH